MEGRSPTSRASRSEQGTTEGREVPSSLFSLGRRAGSLPAQNEGPKLGDGGLSWRGAPRPGIRGGHPSFFRGAGRARAQGREAVSTLAPGASGLLTAQERGPLSFVCVPYLRSAPAQVLEPPLCLGSHTHGSPEGAGEDLAPLGVLGPQGRQPPGEIPSAPCCLGMDP